MILFKEFIVKWPLSENAHVERINRKRKHSKRMCNNLTIYKENTRKLLCKEFIVNWPICKEFDIIKMTICKELIEK